MSERKTLYPRTRADFERIDRMVHRGWSDQMILEQMEGTWRSELIRRDGRVLCATCLEPIRLEYCSDCGQEVAHV